MDAWAVNGSPILYIRTCFFFVLGWLGVSSMFLPSHSYEGMYFVQNSPRLHSTYVPKMRGVHICARITTFLCALAKHHTFFRFFPSSTTSSLLNRTKPHFNSVFTEKFERFTEIHRKPLPILLIRS